MIEAAGIPLLGDDLKSQFGATLLHHALLDTLSRNGVAVRSTSQIVRGGNMDFLNLQDSDRLRTKKTTKIHGYVPPAEYEARYYEQAAVA